MSDFSSNFGNIYLCKSSMTMESGKFVGFVVALC